MSKRKKKSPLRNEFTDALNEEIAERKIVEKTQPAETIYQKTVTLEKKVAKEIPVAQNTPPIEIPPPIEIDIDPKLEERILQEADDVTFEEKPPEPARKSIFRSKALQRWEAEQRGETIEPAPKPAPKVEVQKSAPQKLSHAEKIGLVVSAVMLIYAFATFDKPLFFLALSLFVHFLSRPVGAVFGKHSAAAQNALQTFSIVLFCGAVIFLFT